MDKLKKSVGLKCAAAVVLVVSLAALAISSVLAIVLFDEDAYRSYGRERLYQDRMESIAGRYMSEVFSYYEKIASLTYEGRTKEDIASATKIERERFSEANTNCSFTVTPLYSEDAKVYPTLTNYECNDYQSKYQWQFEAVLYMEDRQFSFSIDMNDIYIDMYQRYITDGDFGVMTEGDFINTYMYDTCCYLSDGEVWLDLGEFTYRLSENAEYQRQWSDFMQEFDNTTETYIYSVDFDRGHFNMGVRVSKTMPAILEMRVKSNLTAEDDFSRSLFLRYMDFVIDATIPVLIASFLLTIVCSVYLISAAGYRKTADGITLNMFDKIPYDILSAALCICIVGMICALDGSYGYYTSVEFIVCVAGSLLGVALIPPFMMTTATRIKVGEWELLKNTIIYRIIRLGWRCVRLAGSWVIRGMRYLLRHLNIYWKYLGIWFGFSLLAVLVMSTGSYEAVFCIGFLAWLAVSIILIRGLVDMNALKKGAQEIAAGNTAYEIDTSHMIWEFKSHGENLNRISDGIQAAVEERMKSERMKTELITNVSHDIKTPLTSIISYVDLLGKEELHDEKAKEYVEVLERQSARLKKLIQDLIDASKASTGNLPVNIEEVDVRVLLEQAMGEFSEKIDKRGLKTIITYHTDPVIAKADGKLLWRTFENLINNITKYAQDNTRVYIDVDKGKRDLSEAADFVRQESVLRVTFKNISQEALNLSGDELMERFVRGDSSRNTEGSGLGLSIAKSLMELQNGELEIIVDGDLFKVVLLLVRA